MLNMADEQIYSSGNKLDRIDDSFLKDIHEDEANDYGINGTERMKVRSLRK